MEELKQFFSCSGDNCFEQDLFNESLRVGVIKYVGYKGLSVQQNPNIIEPFYDLINTVKPKRIIEIGTADGGLTLFLQDLVDLLDIEDCNVITYDVRQQNNLLSLQTKIDVRFENLFNENYSGFKDEKTMKDLSNLIQQPGVTVILCDGGNKINEFKLLSPLLKSGDVIMAHDYAENTDVYESKIKNVFWLWNEIQDSDIYDTCQINNLTPFIQEKFENVVWVCKIKS